MSKIEIVNRALLKLGEPPVSSLNDAAFGRTYDILYTDIKDLLLSSYPWRFAVEVKSLARCEEMFGDKYMYRLPADCLLLMKVFGADKELVDDAQALLMQNYEVANNCVVTAAKAGISVEYVKRIDDDVMFSLLFREALAAKIAAELAMRLKHSLTIKQAFEEEFFALIRQAELNNEILKDVELVPENSWVLVRQAW
ncbi:MAG: hypothetical protein NC218_11025 [Acetobacter sp.]|nr:hypothetical protein [Acetobacter sp.]